MTINSVEDLVGMTMFAFKRIDERIVMYCEDGRIYTLLHAQDCCETVVIDDICGAGGNYSNIKLSTFYYYNRGLSDTEITQNFNATKSRFGL